MSKVENFSKSIDRYWEDPRTISLIDDNLRSIEESAVLSVLKKNYNFADFGCGDGISTARYAKGVKTCTAFEKSEYLYSKALNRFREAKIKNIIPIRKDILQIRDFEKSFDAILTQRTLINLPGWETQKKAIMKIRDALKSKGHYIMIENTYEGFRALNKMRKIAGMEAIPMHWHNVFFHHDKLLRFLEPIFTVCQHITFDLYYFLTRVYMNMFADFKGYGVNAEKDKIFNRSDKAAAKLYKMFGSRIKIGDDYAFGPIQCFVLQKR